MLAAARSQKITLAEAVLRSDLDESRLTEEQSRAAMHHLWQVMQATSREYIFILFFILQRHRKEPLKTVLFGSHRQLR